MGNKTTARYAAVMRVNVPDAPAHVYLVERSDGVIKVGNSRNVRNRLKQLQCQFARAGMSLGRMHVRGGGLDIERRAIQALSRLASPVPGTAEYFQGVEFDVAMRALPDVPATQDAA